MLMACRLRAARWIGLFERQAGGAADGVELLHRVAAHTHAVGDVHADAGARFHRHFHAARGVGVDVVGGAVEHQLRGIDHRGRFAERDLHRRPFM